MSEQPWIKHYDNGVPASIIYPPITVPQLLSNSARKFPNQPCTVFTGAVISYQDIDMMTDKIAAALIAYGVKKGDRIGIFMPNLPQFVIVYFSIMKAGAIVVAINPQYKPREIEYVVNDAGINIIFSLSSNYSILKQTKSSSCLKTIILTDPSDFNHNGVDSVINTLSENMPGIQTGIDLDDKWVKEFLSMEQIVSHRVQVGPEDIALFQYSGGTTGISKAAIVLHRNLVANAFQMRHWLVNTYEGQETVIMAIPLYHVYGMVCGMLYGILLGARIVLIIDPRDIEEIIRSIDKYQGTVFHGVPSLFNSFNVHPEAISGKYRLNSIKACISGSAPLMRATKDRFELITGGKVCEGYGLSEAPTATHCNPLLGENRPGSIGLPLPDVDCRIVNLEDGNTDVPPGDIGELIIRGPQVMKAYNNRPDETFNALRNGWLYTGDIARMDSDGYFYLVDRKKELIKPGGFQVWPREVEEVIASLPKVKEVGVAGICDNQGTELVKAWVVLKPGETASAEEIQAYCQQQLVYYKVPTIVEFRDELPRSSIGKILRRDLVKEFKENQSRL